MFKKVLIAEDFEGENVGVFNTLKTFNIPVVDQVHYCDDAILKIKRAILDNEPYDLLITDLSFKKDHRDRNISSGEELVSAIRKEIINLTIIVYSVEDRLQKARNLIHNLNVNAYVCKGRKGLKDLEKAVQYTANNKLFLSTQVEKAYKKSDNNEINDYDISLLKKIAEGLTDKEISNYFIQQKISPNSISSIEKRVNRLKDLFKAKNKPHLVTLAKDLGFI